MINDIAFRHSKIRKDGNQGNNEIYTYSYEYEYEYKLINPEIRSLGNSISREDIQWVRFPTTHEKCVSFFIKINPLLFHLVLFILMINVFLRGFLHKIYNELKYVIRKCFFFEINTFLRM